MQRIALAAFRGVFGLAYLAIGLYWVWMHLSGRGGGFPAFGEAEKELVTAMNNAGFFEPAVMFSCVVGGALLLFHRTAPAGILVLTPTVVAIFLYHAYLTGALVHGGTQLLWLLALYGLYRRAFLPLLRYGAPAET